MYQLTFGRQPIPTEYDHKHLDLTLPIDSRFHAHLNNNLQSLTVHLAYP